MNVSAAGAGLPSPDPQALRALTLALPNIARSLLTGLTPDTIEPLLGELAAPPMQHLLQSIDERLFQSPAQDQPPPHDAPPHAASTISADARIFSNHPAPAGAYVHDGLLLDAKESAERSVARASHLVELGGPIRTNANDPDPRTVIALANHFIETGQLANYLRAGELAQVVVSWYQPPLPTQSGRDTVRNAAEGQRSLPSADTLKTLLQRAPLLVLLIVWLTVGVVAGLYARLIHIPPYRTAMAASIWGAGFLVLVVFQFLATIRGYRSGKRPVT